MPRTFLSYAALFCSIALLGAHPASGNATGDTTSNANATDSGDASTNAAAAKAPDGEKASVLSGALILSPQQAATDMFYRSPPQFPPSVVTTRTVYKGQVVVIIPAFGNFALAPDGAAKVTYDLVILEPDGKLHHRAENLTAIDGKLPHPNGVFLAQQLGGFFAAEEDPLGQYTFRLTLHDTVSGQTRELSETLNVIPVPAEVELPDNFDPNRWMTGYYRTPQPQFALKALYRMVTDEADLNPLLPPLLGFYNRLLSENAWLLPEFAERFAQTLADPDSNSHADKALQMILAYHLRNTEVRPAAFSAKTWESLREIAAAADWTPADPNTPTGIVMPGQLDYLWGEFFASGAYLPIERIAAALIPTEETAVAERMQHMSKEQRDNFRKVIAATAAWSLRSNAQQHPLVRAYLTGILLTMPEGASPLRDSLQQILAPQEEKAATPE